MIEAALILSGILQLADAGTTLWIIRNGGEEKNPILRWIIGQAGLKGALILKLALALTILAWCWATDFLLRAPWAAYLILALSVAVVVHNGTVIRQMRKGD